MGGGGSEIEENEDSSTDIDNILDPDGAPAHRILCLEITQRPPVVRGRSLLRKIRCTPGVVGYLASVGYWAKNVTMQFQKSTVQQPQL